MKIKSLFLLLAASCFCLILNAKEVPPRPNQLVNDYAGKLSKEEWQRLEGKLRAYNDSSSTQIAIVIDKSLEDEDAFEYALKIAESWGIGRKGKDNGVLIYIAMQERKIQIITGNGVQGFLPDIEVNHLITDILRPSFKANQYYQGLDMATTRIIQLGTGEFKNEKTSGDGEMPLFLILIIIVGVFLVFYWLGRSNFGGGRGISSNGSYDYDGNRRNRRGVNNGGGWFFFPPGGGGSGWNSGGSSGGSDFGDFGGFGGGGFDGGGAGGDW
jgi:uncharacterized protein